ncbi:MAG: hypothetical protein M3033_19725 [Acidobacteriota bacterium]|nr:hypothetical protein [Acidobacteriota bacterium]
MKKERNEAASMQGATQQINGREGETATFLSTGLVNSVLRVAGFAPRHLSRYDGFDF